MNVTHIPSKTHGKRTAGSHNTVIPYHEISDNTAVFSLWNIFQTNHYVNNCIGHSALMGRDMLQITI